MVKVSTWYIKPEGLVLGVAIGASPNPGFLMDKKKSSPICDIEHRRRGASRSRSSAVVVSCATRQSTTRGDARGNTRVRRKHEQYACSDDEHDDDDDDDDEARTRRHTLEGAYRAHARAGEG